MAAALAEAPELVAVAGLLLALLVAYNLRNLLELLAAVFRVIPFAGGWIADHLVDTAIGGLGDFISWAWSAMGWMGGLIVRPIFWMWSIMLSIVGGLSAAADGFWQVVHADIPDAVSTAENYAYARFVDAWNHAENLYTDATSWAAGEFARVTSWFQSSVDDLWRGLTEDYDNAVGHADDLYHAVEADLSAGIGDAENLTRGLVDGAVASFEAGIEDAEQLTRSLVHDTVDWAEGEFSRVEGWTEAKIGDAVTGLEGELGIAATIAATATATVARDLEDYLSKCGRNLCSGLNTLSSLLQALEPLVEGGALALLLSEAVRDPEGVARELIDVVGPLAGGAASGIADVAGLAA